MESVEVSHVYKREPEGFETVKQWTDVLSGGEKQRVAMARLYFHKPRFAILDECTSAVSIDVEDKMYSEAKRHDITLITVSHRKSLWKFHDYVIKFKENSVEFCEMNEEALAQEMAFKQKNSISSPRKNTLVNDENENSKSKNELEIEGAQQI